MKMPLDFFREAYDPVGFLKVGVCLIVSFAVLIGKSASGEGRAAADGAVLLRCHPTQADGENILLCRGTVKRCLLELG